MRTLLFYDISFSQVIFIRSKIYLTEIFEILKGK